MRAAPLHVTFDLDDDSRLCEVDSVATKQDSWLDDHPPDHELSALLAARRGTHGLWEARRPEIQTWRRMIEQYRLLH